MLHERTRSVVRLDDVQGIGLFTGLLNELTSTLREHGT